MNQETFDPQHNPEAPTAPHHQLAQNQTTMPIPDNTVPSSPNNNKPKIIPYLLASVLIIIMGSLSGYGLHQLQANSSASSQTNNQSTQSPDSEDKVQVGSIYGSQNTQVFKDQAEGVLVRGGVNGEGSHHLLRPGGPTQNVYLTSSVVELDMFVDHKVSLSGETFAAQQAGWLMDVGRVEVLELNAEKPFVEQE